MPKSFAQIVLPLSAEKQFTYSVPPSLRNQVKVGSRVLVPLGRRTLTGIVVDLVGKSPVPQVKEILDLLDVEPIFDGIMLQLTRWIADYYLCSWGEALKAALPAGLWRKGKRLIRLSEPYADALAQKLRRSSPLKAEIVRTLMGRGEVSDTSLARRVGREGLFAALAQLQDAGYLEMREEAPRPGVGVRKERAVRLTSPPEEARLTVDGLRKSAPRQAAGLEALLELGGTASTAKLSQKVGISSEGIHRLADKGLVELFERDRLREAYADLTPESPPQHRLTLDQRRALGKVEEAIESGQFAVFLLHGVTGSGKTEVYIQAIHQTLKKGRQAIVLVPEISLTPQTVARFRAHFGSQVAVFHSGLSLGERYDAWRRMRAGHYKMVVGARSAIFAPLQDVGLIVVDEEHVDSYKQSEAQPRYHARDVAVMRGKLSGAVVLLGSATPSLESYHNAQRGKFHFCPLPQRIEDLPMPEVHIVDMRQERKEGNWGIFSGILREQVAQRLHKGEQIILFLNRRGFSTCIKCQECGFVMACPHCDVTLTYHAQDLTVKCHYCGFRQPAPHVCPSCRGQHIKFRGTGTQRVEREVLRLFPQASVLRMDQDTTARKGAHRRILEGFRQGQADILLGTQMIAKGLDFPRVTLVGVISADQGLNLPDFRSAEKTFQLITQVAGRAGRGDLGGEVLVQTYSPEETSIRLSQNHDYMAFVSQELAGRRELAYPPFGKLLLLLLQSTEEIRAVRAAQKLGAMLREEAHRCPDKGVQVLGPAPAPLTKIRGQHRWQILLKGPKSASLRRTFHQIRRQAARWPPWPGVRVRVVVDPVEML
jgi:primosomal protein N' (replication factor Y)